jgi:hypothetical protein
MDFLNSKALDVKMLELERRLGALPPAAIVSLDTGILMLARTPWRRPRIRRIYDRIGFIGLGPIPAHFSQIHERLSSYSHRIGTLELGPEDVRCEDLATEVSRLLAEAFHNDSYNSVHYLFAEVMLAEISLAERDSDYLSYVTYDGKVVEASDSRGAILVSGLSWHAADEEDEEDEVAEIDEVDENANDDSRGGRLLAKRILDAFEELWTPNADPRIFISKYAELVNSNSSGVLEIGWLDRGMVWHKRFDETFFLFRGAMPQEIPTLTSLFKTEESADRKR